MTSVQAVTEGPTLREVGSAVREAVSHFNGRRYLRAYECWRTPLLAAEPEERRFFEGLRRVTLGLHHLQGRHSDASRRELQAGIELLTPFLPAHAYLVVGEVVDVSRRLLQQLNEGTLPYLIGPVIKFADMSLDADWLLD